MYKFKSRMSKNSRKV